MVILAGRRAHGLMNGILAIGILAFGAACGKTTGGTNAADQLIGISTSQMFVTIENRAGIPLMDIKVNIVPVGRATTFIATWTRMEASEKHDFSLGAFRGQDGTPLNLRIHRPQSVVVTATDINQKAYKIESPW
ncbi:MAG: hypothetical protein HYZ58_18015 [Acidobacteria bacterium]|nr:hypothetical protein [Acidobacteriota bacterium]MBI3265026.1 hypothetical protein [Acidobacteriota bacterium]